jgi:hypothetical protein
MSVVEGPKSTGLIARVQGILLRPSAEWDVIDAEPATIGGLFTGYACILAAIGPIALIISHLGLGFLGGMFGAHWGLAAAIVIAVLTYVASLVGVFIVGLIIDGLAPSFDGQKNAVQAMKLAVYSYTAAWVAGILNIVPLLGILGIVALIYGFYILYQGMPKLMKSPPEKTTGYFVVTLVVAFVINALIYWVIGIITAMMVVGAALGGAATLTGAAVNAGNLARLEAASKQIEQAAQGAQTSGTAAKTVAAVDPAKIEALLPATVAGLSRTDVSSASAGAAGVGASNVKATYGTGDAEITLTVTDTAAMGAFAGMAAAMGVQSNEENANGYRRVSTQNGQLTTEEWDRAAGSGKYGVMVASRFMVEAEGKAKSIDDLKAAVAAVGPDRLQALANG